MSERIIIFDTTLRDGEQSPGASLGAEAKLKLARQLAKLKVDVIEAGFPASSPGDLRSVRTIAEKTKGPVIAALARCIKKDIDLAVQALEPAVKKRLHIFLATSAIHRKYKLKKAKQEILRLAVESVKYGRRFCDDVEFSPEDASRTEPDYLCQVVEAVIEAGATVVNIPDTVGYATPVEFGRLIATIKSQVPNIENATLSIHCHDDLGLATSNSLSAVENGARQVECTVNGIGERAGNASLEEMVMILKTREDYFGFRTGIKTKEIYPASRLVTTLTGIHVQPNKAIVGDNAFKHEAGIHQDGVLKEKRTYEIMSPESIGLKESKLVLGKHSGRHAFGKRLEGLGYKLSEKDMLKAFERFKRLADKKKEIYDEDLTAIIEDEISAVPETFKLVYVHTTSGSQTVPTATVRLKKEGKIFQDAACGDGPVDAAYKTIDKITGLGAELVDYSLRAVTSGKDALGEVTVRIRGKRKGLCQCR
jgi:2-isopropylmalate synthase